MWRHLLKLYDESRLNEGQPECLFAETLVFNEGWLLRSVMKEWKVGETSSRWPFLPFPADARIYSEGQLRTPFRARRRGDSKAETHSRVDGIAGHFSIAPATKSGIQLDPDCWYVAVFEAKLFSPLDKETKHGPGYDQVSRIAACLIHGLLEAGRVADCAAHLVVLYPEDSPAIKPKEYAKVKLRERIKRRLGDYQAAGDPTPEIVRFEAGWEKGLERLAIHFETWEEVLGEIGDGELQRFYELCKVFAR